VSRVPTATAQVDAFGQQGIVHRCRAIELVGGDLDLRDTKFGGVLLDQLLMFDDVKLQVAH
jgi:hypothetical protein